MGLHFEILEMEVITNHMNMLFEVNPQFVIHKAVKRIERRISHDLRAEFASIKRRVHTLWSNSYFVSAVRVAPLSIVKLYIENQKMCDTL